MANWNPARIPPQTPPAGGKSAEAKRKILFSRKTDFRFAESALKPHALPEYLEGRTPKEKHPFLFQKKSGARKIKNARSVFSFVVAGVLASAWGFNADSEKRKSVFLEKRIFRFASADFPPAGGIWGGMRAGFQFAKFFLRQYKFIYRIIPPY